MSESATLANYVKLCFISFTLVLTSCADFNFDIRFQNATTTALVCLYGESKTGHYFDVFRNGRQCLHAAFGACAPVVSRGCRCEEEMAMNEARFMIDSPSGYDTLECKVLGGVSEQKTINVTSYIEPQTPDVFSHAQPTTPEPSLTTSREADRKPESYTERTVLTLKILLGLSISVNILLVAFIMFKYRKRIMDTCWPVGTGDAAHSERSTPADREHIQENLMEAGAQHGQMEEKV